MKNSPLLVFLLSGIFVFLRLSRPQTINGDNGTQYQPLPGSARTSPPLLKYFRSVDDVGDSVPHDVKTASRAYVYERHEEMEEHGTI